MARIGVAAVLVVSSLAGLTSAGAAPAVEDPTGQVAYTAGGRIYVVRADGSSRLELARGEGPSWSPTGTALAFHSARVPRYGLDIYLMDGDGSHQRRVVSHPTAGGEESDNTKDDFEPSWSPDGAFVAFTTVRDGNAEIYRMDTTGHSTARLTNNAADDRDPAWSPDGTAIAFVSDRGGNEDVYAMRADSTAVRQLTRAGAADRGPSWSPDGRLLAFESRRDGNSEIYVMAADGRSEHRLTDDAASDTRPAWSPDGRSIVFTRSDESGRRLVVMSVADGSTRSLTTPTESADGASWQPGVDLALSVARSGRLRPRAPARLSVTVRNRLSAPAFYVDVAIAVPRGVRVVGVRAAGAGACTRTRPLTCSLRMLRSSTRMSAHVILRPLRCGSFAVRTSVGSLQRDVRPANNRRSTRLAVAC